MAERSIGGMWEAETKKGDPMWRLEIDGARYVAFPNDYKTADNNQPDYRIYPARERDENTPY